MSASKTGNMPRLRLPLGRKLTGSSAAGQTHKWTFSLPFPLPNFGRSFIVANDQLATLDIH